MSRHLEQNICKILLEKCGDAPPTGDYDNEWTYKPVDIPPFTYSLKKDQAYLTTWEGGHYSIKYVNVPTSIAGVSLVFTHIESFYRPCDYRGKGRVHMYKTQRGLACLINIRLRQGLRRIIRRWIAKKYVKNTFGNDMSSIISRYL